MRLDQAEVTIVDVPYWLGPQRKEFRAVLRLEPCAYCPRRRSGTVDHVHPRKHGGENHMTTNVVGACGACNVEKDTTKLLFWLLERA